MGTQFIFMGIEFIFIGIKFYRGNVYKSKYSVVLL